MKFGQLILRKVIQIVATRCHVLKFFGFWHVFGAENAPNSISAGAPPQTPLGECCKLPQTLLAGFKGAYFQG